VPCKVKAIERKVEWTKERLWNQFVNLEWTIPNPGLEW